MSAENALPDARAVGQHECHAGGIRTQRPNDAVVQAEDAVGIAVTARHQLVDLSFVHR